jgi:hypothetical protein
MCKDFRKLKVGTENTNQEGPFRYWPRETLLKTPIPRWMGLDLYFTATK